MLARLRDGQGTTNLLSRALAAVDKKLDVVPDPTQLSYHLPKSQRFPQVCLSVSQCLISASTVDGPFAGLRSGRCRGSGAWG